MRRASPAWSADCTGDGTVDCTCGECVAARLELRALETQLEAPQLGVIGLLEVRGLVADTWVCACDSDEYTCDRCAALEHLDAAGALVLRLVLES